MAGIFPGLVLALMFMGYVALMSRFSKDFVSCRPNPECPFCRKGQQTPGSCLPVILLILLVIGSMYLGFATATEAAAFGVLGSLAPGCWLRGRSVSATFIDSLMGATRTSAMIALDPGRGGVPLPVHGLYRSSPRPGRLQSHPWTCPALNC